MISKIQDFIAEHGLLSQDDLHLVALSGGADSVALLLVLQKLGYRIEAVHCNFHLRGEESERDEHFCQELCKRETIPFHHAHFDTREYATLHHLSIEMAARELRYRYFEQLRSDISAATVCVGHHRDDAVETFLMALMRGSGIHGLTGIRPKHGHIVRPLLGVSRKEILEFLDSIGQDYVTDSTNLSPDEALRNKVRLQLLPLMEQIQTGTTDNIARTYYYISEAEKVYNAVFAPLRRAERPNRMTFTELFAEPSPVCLLHEWLSPAGFNRSQISQILAHSNGNSGREFFSSTHSLLIDRAQLLLEPLSEPMKPLIIPEPGNYLLTDGRCLKVELTDDLNVSRLPFCASLDACCVHFPLTLRPVQSGDRFQPFGMKGTRLVSDYLTDLKIPLTEKRRQLVVTQADGSVVWLVGRRTDNRCRVTTLATRRVLRLLLK